MVREREQCHHVHNQPRRHFASYSYGIIQGPADRSPARARCLAAAKRRSALLANRFEGELKSVHGEVIRCATISDVQKQLAELVKQAGWTSIGVMYRPICCDAVKELDPKASMAQAELGPRRNGRPRASIVAADILLADTGSSLIACPTAEDACSATCPRPV